MDGSAIGAFEEPQEPSVRAVEAGSKRKPILAVVIVAGIAALLLLAFLLVFFVMMPQLVPPQWDSPNVDMVAHQTNEGYDIIIATDREEPLNRFELHVLKDGSFWQYSETPLSEGNILVGPFDECLNFTDLTGDGRLSNGDSFTAQHKKHATV